MKPSAEATRAGAAPTENLRYGVLAVNDPDARAPRPSRSVQAASLDNASMIDAVTTR
jgi:hypothetical protein